jgi:sarcosine oxidase/L-pipecolate oxidase
MDQESILIVGAGVFGASTALHLSLGHPRCLIKLVDRGMFPNPRAASFDINKVARAGYEDIA